MNIDKNTWKTLGCLITRKLLYYAFVLIVLTLLGSAACTLMNIAGTLIFFLGFILLMVDLALFFVFLLREIFYWLTFSNNSKTETKT